MREEQTQAQASVSGRRRIGFRTSRAIPLVSLALLLPTLAGAAPITYGFSSGSVTLRAALENTTTSVLSGPNPVEILLGGTSVTFDSAAGPFGP